MNLERWNRWKRTTSKRTPKKTSKSTEAIKLEEMEEDAQEDFEIDGSEGAPAPGDKPPVGDEGAPAYGDETQEVEAPPRVQYTLRSRTNPTNNVFRAAVDEPFNTKSYFPPRQLLYKDIFGYVMTQFASDPEFGITLTQMSAEAGLKKYGRKAEEARMAEFSQLEDLDVYLPLDPRKLTRTQK